MSANRNAALRYVRKFLPEVSGIVIHPDGRWMFFTPNNEVPSFDGLDIDTSVLETLLADEHDGVSLNINLY